MVEIYFASAVQRALHAPLEGGIEDDVVASVAVACLKRARRRRVYALNKTQDLALGFCQVLCNPSDTCLLWRGVNWSGVPVTVFAVSCALWDIWEMKRVGWRTTVTSPMLLWAQRAPLIYAMYDELRERQKQRTSQLIVWMLQAHSPKLESNAATSIRMLNAVETNVCLTKLVLPEVAHPENEVALAIDQREYGPIAETHGASTHLGPRDTGIDNGNDNRIQQH